MVFYIDPPDGGKRKPAPRVNAGVKVHHWPA